MTCSFLSLSKNYIQLFDDSGQPVYDKVFVYLSHNTDLFTYSLFVHSYYDVVCDDIENLKHNPLSIGTSDMYQHFWPKIKVYEIFLGKDCLQGIFKTKNTFLHAKNLFLSCFRSFRKQTNFSGAFSFRLPVYLVCLVPVNSFAATERCNKVLSIGTGNNVFQKPKRFL